MQPFAHKAAARYPVIDRHVCHNELEDFIRHQEQPGHGDEWQVSNRSEMCWQTRSNRSPGCVDGSSRVKRSVDGSGVKQQPPQWFQSVLSGWVLLGFNRR
jgi:hypothetical protein